MRILITGAGGFVGMHLWRELGDHGHELIGIDKKFYPAEHDLLDLGSARRHIEEEGPDYVVHLAALYGRILCRDDPRLAIEDNTGVTTDIATACAEFGIPVLYASSSEVYGDHGTDEITEDSELRMPSTIYGLTKRWGEEALALYLHPEDLCIVRMNMVYGPGQNVGYGQCALSTFIDCAVKGEPFAVHRGTSRSWLYVDDCVRALRLLVEERRSGVWNLGNTTETLGTATVAAFVTDAADAPMDLAQITDPPPDQIPHKNYNCDKLEEALDWWPEVPLIEGIVKTVEWAEAQRKEEDARDAHEPVS